MIVDRSKQIYSCHLYTLLYLWYMDILKLCLCVGELAEFAIDQLFIISMDSETDSKFVRPSRAALFN